MDLDLGKAPIEVGDMPIAACVVCMKKGVTMACSKCHYSYYCSTVCQQVDWKENNHKEFCKKITSMISEIRNRREKMETYVQNYVEYANISLCPTCQQPFESFNKVQLPNCHHFLCVKCITEHTHTPSFHFQCPLCLNADGYNILLNTQTIVAEWMFDITTLSRVHSKPLIKKYAEITLKLQNHSIAIQKEMLQVCYYFGNTETLHRLKVMRLQTYLENYSEAKQLAEEFLEKKYVGGIGMKKESLMNVADAMICLAQCTLELNYPDSDKATAILSDAYHSIRELGAILKVTCQEENTQLIKIYRACMWIGYRCADYDKVIHYGSHFLNIVRTASGYIGYDMMGKAYMALGEYDKAINTVKRGLRFETLWDPDTKDYLQGMLREAEELKRQREISIS